MFMAAYEAFAILININTMYAYILLTVITKHLTFSGRHLTPLCLFTHSDWPKEGLLNPPAGAQKPER
jgi:hypothetical protein